MAQWQMFIGLDGSHFKDAAEEKNENGEPERSEAPEGAWDDGLRKVWKRWNEWPR